MMFYQGITDFIFVEHQVQKADIIFVPGGNYPDAAMHAARLYREGWAPYVMPSGKYSILKGSFAPEAQQLCPAVGKTCQDDRAAVDKKQIFATEWEYLSHILKENGVPDAAILREDEATFTWENAIYSRRNLDQAGISVKRAILACQAFHARRCLMYYQEQFPETEFLVCPVVTRGISKATWQQSEEGIDTVLGEVERCGSQFHAIMRGYMNKPGTAGVPRKNQKNDFGDNE